jgi:hypothetical protein
MELTLNLLWLLVGTGAFTALRIHWRKHDRCVPWCVAALALFCVVVLLFPVISASDDMQASSQMAEESSYRSLRVAAQQHPVDANPGDVDAGNITFLPPARMSAWARIAAEAETSAPADGFGLALECRAPPTVLI